MTIAAYSVKEGQRFATSVDMVVVSCPTCSITYALPERLYLAAHDDYPGGRKNGGWSVYCPMGHEWHYVCTSVRAKLKDERARTARLTAQLDQTHASLTAQRGAATRARNERDQIKRRVAHGVCPCCGRTFKQLARHMASQHPDFEHAS